MQTTVGDREALGAKVLRQLDMDHFKECLKRSYVDGPGASILHAQTTIEKGRENVFAPEYEVDDAMGIDHEAVIDEYKGMTFLQTNQRQFSPKLYSELPETPQRELEIEGEMVGPRHRRSSSPSSHGCATTTLENFASLGVFGGWPMDGSTHPNGPSS